MCVLILQNLIHRSVRINTGQGIYLETTHSTSNNICFRRLRNLAARNSFYLPIIRGRVNLKQATKESSVKSVSGEVTFLKTRMGTELIF